MFATILSWFDSSVKGLFILLIKIAYKLLQRSVAAIMTVGYALVQMVVLVGIILQIIDEPCGPNAIFFYFVVGTFLLAGLLHPQVVSQYVLFLHLYFYFLLMWVK